MDHEIASSHIAVEHGGRFGAVGHRGAQQRKSQPNQRVGKRIVGPGILFVCGQVGQHRSLERGESFQPERCRRKAVDAGDVAHELGPDLLHLGGFGARCSGNQFHYRRQRIIDHAEHARHGKPQRMGALDNSDFARQRLADTHAAFDAQIIPDESQCLTFGRDHPRCPARTAG